MPRTIPLHPVPSPAEVQPSASAAPPLVGARLPRRAALAALLLPLAACAAEPEPATGAGSAADAPAPGADSAAEEDAVTVAEAWVKAAEEHMTSAFGVLRNDTDTDLVLRGARTDASARVELHETASDGSGGMSMQEKEGGFPLPAGEELILEPGGNHLMLMEIAAPLLPGDEVELILEFEDGTEHPFTATVKDFAGAQEHYEPEGSTGTGASDGGGEHAAEHEDDE